MQMGLQIWPCYPSEYGNHFDTMLAVVQACEQAGLDSVWMPDHFMFEADESMFPNRDHVPVMECFVVLGAIAAKTSRIRIGQLVTGVPYRNPALLAKMCATLDVISHGRSIVGLGAAWHEPEFTAYGWPFPSVAERMEMLEEVVQIVDLMLTERPANFTGKHYTIQDAYNDPMPVQKPRPPIMIGSIGPRMLSITMPHADSWNAWHAWELQAILQQGQGAHRNHSMNKSLPNSTNRLKPPWNGFESSISQKQTTPAMNFLCLYCWNKPARPLS